MRATARSVLLLVACAWQGTTPFDEWVRVRQDSGSAAKIGALVAQWRSLAVPSPAPEPEKTGQELLASWTQWTELSAVAVAREYQPGGRYFKLLDAEFSAAASALRVSPDHLADERKAQAAVVTYDSAWLSLGFVEATALTAANQPSVLHELVLDDRTHIPLVVGTGIGDPLTDPADPAKKIYRSFEYRSLIRADDSGERYLAYAHCLYELTLAIRTLDKLRVDADLVAIRRASTRWQNRLLEGYYQYPWELILNGAIVPSTWDEPNRFQLVVLHPELGMAFSPSRSGGANPQPDLLLHTGFVYYLGAEFGGYVGAAVTGSMAQDIGFGYGVSLLAGSSELRSRGIPSISIGVERFDDPRETYVTVGLDFFKSSVGQELFAKP